jgi:hypothetical protein
MLGQIYSAKTPGIFTSDFQNRVSKNDIPMASETGEAVLKILLVKANSLCLDIIMLNVTVFVSTILETRLTIFEKKKTFLGLFGLIPGNLKCSATAGR